MIVSIQGKNYAIVRKIRFRNSVMDKKPSSGEIAIWNPMSILLGIRQINTVIVSQQNHNNNEYQLKNSVSKRKVNRIENYR